MMGVGGSRSARYAVAAVLVLLYAAASAWFVAGEGQAHREALAARLESPLPPAEPSASISPTPSLDPVPSPPTTEPVEPKRVEPKPVVPKPAEPKSKPAEPKPVEPDPKVADSSPPAPAKAQPPRSLDPFWDDPAQKKIWDFGNLSVEDERDLGDVLHQMVLHVQPEIDVGPLPRRVKEAAAPFLEKRSRPEVKYTFTVLDCPNLNVFSLPGGHVYVCRGFFDWFGEDEDYALGFALGHEIAHVDMKHALTCLKDPGIKRFKFGTSFLFYSVVIPAGYYPESMDLDADRWAAIQMLKAGRSRYEVLAFLRRLDDYAKVNGFENKRRNPKENPELPLIDKHIRSHPIPSERLDALRALIDRPLKR